MNKATQHFLEELKANPTVVGVILFGSWARGNNRQGSDVDLLILLETGYRKEVETRDGQVFEIIYTTPTAALQFWKEHKDGCAGFWDVAKILYSKEGVVEELEQEAHALLREGKALIPDAERKQILFDKQDKLRYIKSTYTQDKATANLIFYDTVSKLTELYFDLRQRWIPAPKQRLQAIDQTNSDLAALFRQAYADDTSLEVRLMLLEKMIEQVFDHKE